MPFLAPIIEGVVAIGAAVSSFVAGIGVVGQGLIMAGIGIAASYLINVLTPKQPAPVGGVNFERDYGTNVSRQVACGKVAMAGHDIYVNTSGPSNVVIQQIYVVSDFYVTALTNVWAGGVKLILGADDGTGRGQPVIGPVPFILTPQSVTFSNLVFIKFVSGHQSAADPGLVNAANPAGRWNAADIGIGVSHIIVTMYYDQNNNNSFPDFFFEFQGAPLYDWRKDSTVGGSGSHRWGDITTYEFSANPIVIEYNYRRGFSINGDLFCGMGMPASDLPLDKFTAAANLCDEVQPDGLPLYQCSILLDCMKTHSDNLQSIALSCGAMQVDTIEGSWPLVGSDQTVVAPFSDDDIVSMAANFKRTEKQSMATLVNSVSGNYPEPLQLWSMVGYDPQFATPFIPIDRRTRDINMDFPQVPSLRQADQLAWIYLYENRFETTATVTLRPRFQVLESGDWVNWNSTRYGSKTFIVIGKQLLNLDSADGPRNVVLSLQERNGEIYNGVTPVPSVLPLPSNDPIYMAEVTSFALVPVNVTGASGRLLPAIRVSWDAITDVTVVSVELEYYPTDQPTSVFTKTVPATQSVVVLSDGVVSSTNYTVRAKIIANPSRTTVFNAGSTVTTPDLGSIGFPDFTADVQYNIATLQGLNSDKLANIEALLSSVMANIDAKTWNYKQQLRSDISATAGLALAEISDVRTVAVDANTAVASLSTSVTAQFGTVNASVTTNANAIATLDGYAAAEYSITLDVNGYATGFNLLNGGSGISAAIFTVDKFGVAFPGHAGGGPINVFTIGTVSGAPAIGISANMFIDGTITATMMNVTSLSAISANVGTLTAGILQSVDAKFVINLTGRTLIISD